jgi:VWFA-related protein
MILGFRGALRIAGLPLLCAIALAFQAPPEGPLPAPRVRPQADADAGTPAILRVNSSLVLIPAHVTTATGASVTNLRKENFILLEDGIARTITHFAQDDAPLSAGVLLDISGSMKNKMVKTSEAAAEFFKTANPEDEFFLVEFNGHPNLKVPFTHDWREIPREIAKAKAFGLTALLDAVHLSIAEMKHARNERKALIILSDGGDNFSRRSLHQLSSTLLEAGVQVYAMGVFDRDYPVKHTREEQNGPGLLDRISSDSGGRAFPLVSLDNLPGVGAQMALELRNQYVLGFSPSTSVADGKYHRVDLTLAPPDAQSDLRVYYRRGYYAPAQ